MHEEKTEFSFYTHYKNSKKKKITVFWRDYQNVCTNTVGKKAFQRRMRKSISYKRCYLSGFCNVCGI